MKKTNNRLGRYWDKQVLKIIPPYARFSKVKSEVLEHFSFLSIVVVRLLLPIIFIYFVLGLFVNLNLFAPLILSLIVFLYSNFLPDIDFLIKQTNKSAEESLWYEKYFVLFFAPIVVFYVIQGRAKPVKSKQHRCFHNLKSLIIYTIFLFVLSNIFWDESIKIIIFPLFGFLGYAVHLTVDGVLSLRMFKKNK